MHSLLDVYNRLEISWIPKTDLGALPSELAELECDEKALIRLISLEKKIESKEDLDKRVREIQLRAVRAIVHCLNRTGAIDWDATLLAADSKDLLEIFYTLGFSRFSVGSPSQMRKEYGRNLVRAIQKKFNGHS